MAAIKETLKLEDMFSNTLRSYIDLMSKGKATTDQERIALQELQNVSNAYKAVSSASTAEHKQSTAAKEQETEEINQQAAAQRLLAAETDAATAAIRKQNEELKQHKLKQDEAEKGTSSLARGLKNLASAYTVYKAAELIPYQRQTFNGYRSIQRQNRFAGKRGKHAVKNHAVCQ